jgi:bleomycin hydrolase
MSVLKDVYRVLTVCLGTPPTEFTWRFQNKDKKIQTVKSTPVDFFNSIAGTDYNTENYVMIMNDPTRDYYKMYEIDGARNTMDGINWTYLNLPNEDIKKAVLASIKANESVVGSCDVGKQSNTKNGLLDPGIYDYASLLGINLNMDKKARIVTRQSGSSHAMLIVACDTDDNDVPTKWEFENSWGEDAGNKGYLTFTDNWFNEYMFRFVINKKYLDSKAIGCLGQKHIMLPPWDYMN